MHWSFVHGSDLTVLYNDETCASIALDQTFGQRFWFISGKGAKCKSRISWAAGAVKDNLPYSFSNLLSALQAGKGTKMDSSSQIDGAEWISERAGQIIALQRKSGSSERIYLTADGFIHTTADGAAIITENSEIFTTTERAQLALDIAIAQSTKTNRKLDSLQVAMLQGLVANLVLLRLTVSLTLDSRNLLTCMSLFCSHPA
jgi:hypothetical protein